MTKTILAVEDSQTIRQAIEWTFLASDFSVVMADSGRSAVGQLSAASPDLVLLDVSLPDQDGYQVAQSIRAQQPGVPIVLLTSQFSAFDDDRARASGVSAHIGKPFDTQALIDLVTAQIANAVPAPEPAPAARPRPGPGPGSFQDALSAQASEPSISLDISDPVVEPPPPAPEAHPTSPLPSFDRAGAMGSDASLLAQAEAGPTLEPPRPPAPGSTSAPVDVWALSEEVDEDDVEEIEEIDIEDVPDETLVSASSNAPGLGFAPPPAPPPPAPSLPPAPEPPAAFDAEPAPSWGGETPEADGAASPSPAVEAAAEQVLERAQAGLPAGLPPAELRQIAREVIEKVAWDVVPELAEAIIREELARLTRD